MYDTTSEHWVLDVVDEQQWDETDEQEELDEQPQPQLGGGGGGGGALPAERFIVGSSSGPSDELVGGRSGNMSAECVLKRLREGGRHTGLGLLLSVLLAANSQCGQVAVQVMEARMFSGDTAQIPKSSHRTSCTTGCPPPPPSLSYPQGGLLPAKARPAAAKGPTPDRAATTATSTAAAPPSSSPSLQRSPDTTSSSNGTPGPQATRSGSDSGDGSDTMDETEQEGAQQGGGRTPIFLLPGVTVSVRAADGTLLRLRPAFLSLQQLGGLVALCRDVAASAWRAQRSMERWRVVGALDVLAVHSAGGWWAPGRSRGGETARSGGKNGRHGMRGGIPAQRECSNAMVWL